MQANVKSFRFGKIKKIPNRKLLKNRPQNARMSIEKKSKAVTKMKIFFAVTAVLTAFLLGVTGTILLEKRLCKNDPTAPEEP